MTEEILSALMDAGVPEDEIQKLAREKAEEYGGYISQEGILFIIAKEMGIR